MEEDVYKTIAGPAEGLYKEKGSKFIALAYPVRTEEEVKDIVAGIKTGYYDARHHCYAYRLGATGLKFRANDDGEPSSTAGKPILGQIVSAGLTDVLIVVVRYFGGIKLGVSGLIHAYRTAAADVLARASVVEKTVDDVFRIVFSYAVLNEVMRIVKEENPQVGERDFALQCRMRLVIRRQGAARLKARLSQIPSLSFED